MNKYFKSPDGTKTVSLIFLEENRFGYKFYRVKLENSFDLGYRLFGGYCIWSPDSRYCAFQNWVSTNPTSGPKTKLVIIDTGKNMQFLGEVADKGFVVPDKFENGTLKYHIDSYPAKVEEREISMEFIENWRKI